MKEARYRLFIALDLPPSFRSLLEEATAVLRSRSVRMAPVRAENLHLTLRFLGTVDSATLCAIEDRFGGLLLPDSRAFQVVQSDYGTFPGRDGLTVWAGLRIQPRLKDFVDRLYTLPAAPAAGRPRSFQPHVTLARRLSLCRPEEGLPELPRCPDTLLLPTVTLYLSEQTAAGQRYTALCSRPSASLPSA